jgi:hypothetical protein
LGKKVNTFILTIFLGTVQSIYSQKIELDFMRDVIEKYIENIESELDYTDLYDQIEYYYRNPININSASYNDLLKIPLITPLKAQAIFQHRQQYGPFNNIYELQTIDVLEFEWIITIKFFIKTDNRPILFNKKEFWQNSKHEIVLQSSRRIEKSVGYLLPDSNKNKFKGDPNKLSIRYRGNINPNFTIGFQAEKDPGETYSNGFVSGFIHLKKYRLFENLIIGDFQAAFGQGLTFGSGLAFGKSPFVLNTIRTQNGIRVSRSFNENEFLRGIGTVLKLRHNILLTSFVSSKKIDATVIIDSAFGDGFSSLINTGNYRNQTELGKKGLLKRQILGSNLSIRLKDFKIGITAINTTYDKPPFVDDKKPYRAFYSNEKQHYNLGTDYQYLYKNLLFYGEFSSNGNLKQLSHVIGLMIALDKNLEINLLHRNYRKDYQPAFSNAIGESADNRNERGTYMGIALKPAKNYSVNAYADLYRFDWLKYLIDAPSGGRDMMIELQYEKRRRYLWYVRYRQEEKERNLSTTDNIRGLGLHKREIIRFHIENMISKRITIKNRIEQTFYAIENGSKTRGLVIFQDINFKTMDNFNIIARYMYFESDDYNSRVYAFENDLLYTFSVPAFQNRGTRFYVMGKYKLSRATAIWVRYSRTFYDNISAIGSGNDRINKQHLTNISFQLSCHF